jgi:hypothetical protein
MDSPFPDIDVDSVVELRARITSSIAHRTCTDKVVLDALELKVVFWALALVTV